MLRNWIAVDCILHWYLSWKNELMLQNLRLTGRSHNRRCASQAFLPCQ